MFLQIWQKFCKVKQPMPSSQTVTSQRSDFDVSLNMQFALLPSSLDISHDAKNPQSIFLVFIERF